MPSQMSGNGTNNQYHFNKIINYSIIENNNGHEQYRSTEGIQVKAESAAVNNNLPSINTLERGMSELCTFSLPIASSNMGLIEEYRRRLCSEDLGHQRPVIGSSLRRADTTENDLDIGMMNIRFQRELSENSLQWTQESFDESALRDMCARDAQQLGFIVGDELEVVKAKSHRSVIQNTPDRIISTFKDRYGQADSMSKKTYLQLGVRVPTKEHVSEIVGKQGSKIKQIREKTGALITTPGEQEDHVFIIEAPPRTALHVAQLLKSRAEDITMSRSQDSRRRGSCPSNSINRHINKSPAVCGFSQTASKIVLASGRIHVPKIIVGRIIGTQGSIITTIQRDTGTEIRSPPKEIGKPKNAMADFEILVYQTSNLTDCHEARQRVSNAKQLIAHVAMHQLEKIRAEEAPYSNYQVQSNKISENVVDDDIIMKIEHLSINDNNREHLLTDQMKPFNWMWSDITKLDDCLAQEVVDRILEESKKKTKTRSEPSIYDNSPNNLFTVGESESYSNGSSEVNKPRHSLPEARLGTIPGFSLDSFYRTSALPYSVNDNLTSLDVDSDYRSSPSMSFVNRRDPGSRSDMSDHDILDFQSQDFTDNQAYTNGGPFPVARELPDQVLLHHMYMNGVENHPPPFNGNYGRFVLEQGYCEGNGSSPNPYFPFLGDGQWGYDGSMQPSTQSYADSVKPPGHSRVSAYSTSHGTIGDHLKKGLPYNYK